MGLCVSAETVPSRNLFNCSGLRAWQNLLPHHNERPERNGDTEGEQSNTFQTFSSLQILQNYIERVQNKLI